MERKLQSLLERKTAFVIEDFVSGHPVRHLEHFLRHLTNCCFHSKHLT